MILFVVTPLGFFLAVIITVGFFSYFSDDIILSIRYKAKNFEVDRILRNFKYYYHLNETDKKKFIKRVLGFIGTKYFVSEGLNEITFEHKVIIASSAVQLTFGLDHYKLVGFNKIHLFPSDYYSEWNKGYHQGETKLNGSIFLSYDNFKEGYENGNDGINLGLHEMAHALSFNSVMGKQYDAKFKNSYNHFYQTNETKYLELTQQENNTLFRDYAQTNFHEFFAVCIENFFERPNLFLKQYPELYNNFCTMLNQNPSKFVNPF